MDDKREIRNTSFQVITEDEKRTVEGYALLFDVKSDGLSFEEIIERGALDGVLAKSDVLALLNHNQGRGVLARSKKGNGSLNLSVDSKGLKYRFDAPKTALGDELLENIRRGEVEESSFAFTVGEDKWEKKPDNTWKRTIVRIGEIFDVSPVYAAAYSKTSVYMRGKEDAEKALREQEEREKEAELSAYWERINNQFNF
ncbi:MAG: HK97 family phage prohead protease [Tannerellaceae bacterium]|jgi:HK97 family phage prohead protease|nr:HK97 family phage prohead protease [Tannerellaceae bacterium]